MEQTTSCVRCGTRFAASRDRCPKCREVVARVDAAADAARSRKLAQIAGAIVGVFALVVGGLWVTRDQEPAAGSASTSRPAADPLAARRPAVARPADAAPPAPDDSSRRFLDSADKGALAYEASNYGDALARFEEAVKQNPQDAESLSNLGQVLVRLQRTAEALPHFERAVALNPDRWAYRFNLARAYGLLQRWDDAIASYRRAQTLFPDDYATTFNLALAMHKKGDDAGAIGEYKKAIALNPEEPSYRMALAISHEALQQAPEAVSQYSEYLRLSPLASDAEKVRARIAQLTRPPAAPPAPPAAPGQ